MNNKDLVLLKLSCCAGMKNFNSTCEMTGKECDLIEKYINELEQKIKDYEESILKNYLGK